MDLSLDRQWRLVRWLPSRVDARQARSGLVLEPPCPVRMFLATRL
jgi:hypothetical protein